MNEYQINLPEIYQLFDVHFDYWIVKVLETFGAVSLMFYVTKIIDFHLANIRLRREINRRKYLIHRRINRKLEL